ncbi:MAG: hypothetical protein ACKOWF_11145, partial [Chloroflexota bacterium]
TPAAATPVPAAAAAPAPPTVIAAAPDGDGAVEAQHTGSGIPASATLAGAAIAAALVAALAVRRRRGTADEPFVISMRDASALNR